MSQSYLSTLEDLAAKRRGLGDVITALAKVVGVDPAPYLDRPAAVTDAEVDSVVNRLRAAAPPKPERPPRPQSPAPPATTGPGPDDKVLQALKNGPLAPQQIRERTQIAEWSLKPVMNRLMTAKKISKLGSGPRNTKYQLTTI